MTAPISTAFSADDLEGLERIESAAYEDLFSAAAPRVRASLGLHVVREGDAVALVAPGIDHVLFNRVIGLDAGGTNDAATMDRFVTHYAAQGVHRYWVHVPRTPSLEPVRAALVRLGLAPYRRAWLKLAARTPSGAPTSRSAVEVVAVPPALASTAGALVARCLGLPAGAAPIFAAAVERPRWHVFAALDGRRVAGVAGLFVHDGVGSLAFAVTDPEMRGRGIQTALIERRIRVAKALGVRLLVSETGEPVPGDPQHSERNLRRGGLVPVYLRDNWAPPSGTW